MLSSIFSLHPSQGLVEYVEIKDPNVQEQQIWFYFHKNKKESCHSKNKNSRTVEKKNISISHHKKREAWRCIRDQRDLRTHSNASIEKLGQSRACS